LFAASEEGSPLAKVVLAGVAQTTLSLGLGTNHGIDVSVRRKKGKGGKGEASQGEEKR
jgi:hypothetical protein